MSNRGENMDQVANDNLMPSQWAQMHRPRVLDGYSRLWWAALQDALRCISQGLTSSGGQRRAWEAWNWFEDESQLPGSFLFVCEGLNLDANGMRKQLAVWRRDGAPKVPRGRSNYRAGVQLRRRA